MGFVAIGNTIINRLVQQNLLPLSQATIDKYVASGKWCDDIRIGRYGQEFRLYKIRTLPPDVQVVHKNFYDTVEEDTSTYQHLSQLDRILRKWADESPQILTNLSNREITWAGPRPLIIPNDNCLPSNLRDARRYFVPGLVSLWYAAEVTLNDEARMQCEWAFMFLALKESLKKEDFELWYRKIKEERYFPTERNYRDIFYKSQYMEVLKETNQNNWPMPSDYPKTEELFFRKAVFNRIFGKHRAK